MPAEVIHTEFFTGQVTPAGRRQPTAAARKNVKLETVSVNAEPPTVRRNRNRQSVVSRTYPQALTVRHKGMLKNNVAAQWCAAAVGLVDVALNILLLMLLLLPTYRSLRPQTTAHNLALTLFT